MFAAFSAVIIAIAAGITLFVQTITLSACRRLECCCGKCEMGSADVQGAPYGREGIASLAPHDAELQHERARAAGPDARAETRRPRRPIEVNTRAGEVASTAAATPAAHYRRLRSIRPCCRGSMWRAPGGDCAAQNKKNRVWPQGDSTLPP